MSLTQRTRRAPRRGQTPAGEARVFRRVAPQTEPARRQGCPAAAGRAPAAEQPAAVEQPPIVEQPAAAAPKPLVFMMGQAPVFLPVDRRYTKHHFWVMPQGEVFRFGLSGYAVRLLGEVRDLEWSVGPGIEVTAGQPLGSIEGSKAVSELYCPAAGKIIRFNLDLLLDPGLIAGNLYDAAWLFEMACATAGFFAPQQYLAYLTVAWPLAERMLKTQAAGRP